MLASPGQPRQLGDVIDQYVVARRKQKVISIREAASVISMVVPINHLSVEQFNEMIARTAADHGLAVRFDRPVDLSAPAPAIAQTLDTNGEAGVPPASDDGIDLRLREMQHRFANCFQVLEILVRFHRTRTTDEEAWHQLDRVLDLIRSVRHLQDRISDSGGIALADHFDELGSIWSSMTEGTPIAIRIEADDVDVADSTAVVLPLIAQELLTNSIEHGFSEGQSGTITVRLERAPDGDGKLTVIDDGRGLSENETPERTNSDGLSLVAALSRSLGGAFTINSCPHGRGAVACVSFPVTRPVP